MSNTTYKSVQFQELMKITEEQLIQLSGVWQVMKKYWLNNLLEKYHNSSNKLFGEHYSTSCSMEATAW